MHPNAVMLAVVLLGNLMLPFISAQNGKRRADVTVRHHCTHRTEGESDLTCVKRRPSEMFSRQGLFFLFLIFGERLR